MIVATDEALSPSLIRQLMRPGALAEDTTPIDLDDAQQHALHDALATLSQDDREFLQLRFEANCSIEEMAAHLLLSPQIAAKLENTILDMLRRHLPPTREDIASSPTRRYVPAEPAPTTTKPNTTESPYERRIGEEQFAAFMAEHPDATYKETREALGISSPTVQRYRRIWQERQAQEAGAAPSSPPKPEPLSIQPPPSPIKEPEPVMEKPVSTPAPYERTLYEEQVYQARLWMEMLERQWREAKENAEEAVEYADTVQQRYLQAKANYERAQKIARAHYAMLHGQVVEELEG